MSRCVGRTSLEFDQVLRLISGVPARGRLLGSMSLSGHKSDSC